MEVVAGILIIAGMLFCLILATGRKAPRPAPTPPPAPQPLPDYIPRWTRARIRQEWEDQVRFQKLLNDEPPKPRPTKTRSGPAPKPAAAAPTRDTFADLREKLSKL